MPNRATLLFHRDYQAFQGGHLKLADYIEHTAASGLFTPRVYVTPQSRPDHPFPRELITQQWRPETANALFVAGMDWAHIPPGLENCIPMLNLIQHPRHALPDDPRFPFLARRATRLCVSAGVADAIRPHANGPVITIPAAMDLRAINPAPKTIPILICGLKNPALAQATAQLLAAQGHLAQTLIAPIPRPAYLAKLAAAQIAILLPDAAEGAYLPALEAMAAGCAVVCPDALGNRAFCRDGDTCLMPTATPEALANAALRLLAEPILTQTLQARAHAEAQCHDLVKERAAYTAVLTSLALATA